MANGSANGRAISQRKGNLGDALVAPGADLRAILVAMGDYRKLEVWKLSISVSDRVDALVTRIGRRDRTGLGDQLARAAESIHLNIAEGCGLNSDAQLSRHTRIALGSANELEDGLAKLHRRGLLQPDDQALVSDVTLLRRKLGALLKRLTATKTAGR